MQQSASPSSRGLGHYPFTVGTGVRIPLGTPIKTKIYMEDCQPKVAQTPQSDPQSDSPNCQADDEETGDQFRAIEDLAFDMGLGERDARAVLAAHGAVIQPDHLDRDAVAISVARLAAQSDDYAPLRDKALADKMFGLPVDGRETRAILRTERLTVIDEYRAAIDALEEIHRRYRVSAHRDGFESSAMAQYLLLSRAIALLRALLDSLAHGHYYALSMMRDIDECLDLAHYFRVTENSERGKRVLRRWFREGQWPSHRECRKSIAKSMSETVGMAASKHSALHAEIYRKKSRHIHPSFLAIRDVTGFGTDQSGHTTVDYVTYGPDAQERRLWEAMVFFRASVLLPTTQALCISLCSTIGVEQKDVDDLLAMVKSLGG